MNDIVNVLKGVKKGKKWEKFGEKATLFQKLHIHTGVGVSLCNSALYY